MLTESDLIEKAPGISRTLDGKSQVAKYKNWYTLTSGVRYGASLVALVAEQRDYLTAARVGGSYVASTLGVLSRRAWFALCGKRGARVSRARSRKSWDEIAAHVGALGIDMHEFRIDVQAFSTHAGLGMYPSTYAGGASSQGGAREMKILEYFVSLELLDIQATDVVVDVASHWSIFPKVIHELCGATVYRQDLIYPEGMNDQWIGGSAARMPVPDEFANKLVLHNAFEHFEGTADTDFIVEAWRILKPGGMLCILPLFVNEKFVNLTDPLVNRRGVVWDDDAQVVEEHWWHNRFGRVYDSATLEKRVLRPAHDLGFKTAIYYVVNADEIHPRAYMKFVLVLHKT